MGMISDRDDFLVKRQAYLSRGNIDPQPHHDFPQHAYGQRLLVREVVSAMLKRDDSTEDGDSKVPLGRISRLSPVELEMMG